MLAVTADTNIFVSALHFGGMPRRFLNLAEAGVIRLAISDEILAEIEKVLAYRRIGWPQERISQAIGQIERFTDRVKSTEILNVISADAADNRILECAVAAKSDYIVTGDKHLLTFQQYAAIRIVKLAEFMDILHSQFGALPKPQ